MWAMSGMCSTVGSPSPACGLTRPAAADCLQSWCCAARSTPDTRSPHTHAPRRGIAWCQKHNRPDEAQVIFPLIDKYKEILKDE